MAGPDYNEKDSKALYKIVLIRVENHYLKPRVYRLATAVDS